MPNSATLQKARSPFLILGLLLFLAAVGVTAYFVAQNNNLGDNRSSAVAAGACNCVNANGVNAGAGSCSGSNCICGPGLRVKANRCSEGGGNPTPGSGGNSPTCSNGFFCGGCVNRCVTVAELGNAGCAAYVAERCGGGTTTGGACSFTQSSTFFKDCTAECGKWFNVTGMCDHDRDPNTPGLQNDGLCALSNCSGNTTPGTTTSPGYSCDNNGCCVDNQSASSYVNKWTCNRIDNLSGGCQDGTPTTGRCQTFSGACGSQQIDVVLNGVQVTHRSRTNTVACGTTTNPPNPTNTPTLPPGSCIDIRIFGEGSQLSPSQVRPGDSVTLAVKGSGTPTKARFRVNGQQLERNDNDANPNWTETTTQDANNFFTVEYTFPENVKDFVIEGEVFVNGNWK
jgi:hypothetical protein